MVSYIKIWQISFAIICLFQICTADIDPCVSYKLLDYVELRAVANILDFGNVLSISDEFLDDGWYRIISEAGEDMPTKPPGSFHCGTNYPIWLNGTLPTNFGGNVTEKVCLQSYTNVCRLTWDIKIKFCAGNYLVYNLITSDVSSSGYCFGTSADKVSKTAYTSTTTSTTSGESSSNFDPCVSYKLLDYVDQRAVANILDFGNVLSISDEFLDDGWYRIISEAGEDMPTKPPGSFHCGTNYPIWLNGTFPTSTGENVTEKVCLQSYSNVCRFTWDINIKLCAGNYLVYNLLSSKVALSGYCFGKGTTHKVIPTSETLGEPNNNGSKVKKTNTAIIVSITLSMLVFVLIVYIVIIHCFRKKLSKRRSWFAKCYTNNSENSPEYKQRNITITSILPVCANSYPAKGCCELSFYGSKESSCCDIKEKSSGFPGFNVFSVKGFKANI